MYNSKQYTNSVDKFYPYPNPALISLLKRIPFKNSSKILDFGCGSGSITKDYLGPIASENNGQVYGVDIQPNQIQEAKTSKNHPHIKYFAGDILSQTCPWENNLKFDIIFSSYVFYIIKDLKTCFKKLFELLKPGGYLGFVVPVECSSFDARNWLNNSSEWKKYMKGCDKYNPDWFHTNNGMKYLQDALKDAGFNIIFHEKERDPATFYPPEELTSFFLANLESYVQNVPQEIYEQLFKETNDFFANIHQISVDNDKEFITYDPLVAVTLVQKPM